MCMCAIERERESRRRSAWELTARDENENLTKVSNGTIS